MRSLTTRKNDTKWYDDFLSSWDERFHGKIDLKNEVTKSIFKMVCKMICKRFAMMRWYIQNETKCNITNLPCQSFGSNSKIFGIFQIISNYPNYLELSKFFGSDSKIFWILQNIWNNPNILEVIPKCLELFHNNGKFSNLFGTDSKVLEMMQNDINYILPKWLEWKIMTKMRIPKCLEWTKVTLQKKWLKGETKSNSYDSETKWSRRQL